MGSIEIKEQPRHFRYPDRQNNYRKTSKSPFRQAISPKSPYYKQVSPIKYAQITPITISDYSKSQSTIRKVLNSPINNKAKIVTKNSRDVEWYNNRQKCEDIIKKVRNFNDFLLQIKNKLKQNKRNDLEDSQVRGKMRLNVKLENERIELEKYKKLVERELSKSHSIESINIENTTGREKILTINYEYNKDISFKQDESPLKIHGTIDYGIENQNQNYDRVVTSKDRNKQLRQFKTRFMVLRRNCRELREKLDNESIIFEELLNEDRLLQLKERNNFIQNMISGLELANKDTNQLEVKVRSII